LQCTNTLPPSVLASLMNLYVALKCLSCKKIRCGQRPLSFS
jgi:hypothetical protein